MTESDAVWGALLLAGAAYEAHTLLNKKPDDTLSESTRRWFQVRTKAGRIAFLVGWVGFAAWLTGHVLDWWW